MKWVDLQTTHITCLLNHAAHAHVAEALLTLQDRSSVEEHYKLVNARDMLTMDNKEVKEHVQAIRAEEEESSDQEPPAAPQPARQAPEARLPKAKRGRKPANGLHNSPARASAAVEQPAQPSQQVSEREQHAQQAQPSSQQPQEQAAEASFTHAAKPAKVAQPPRAQVTVLDTQNRETRLCMWSPTEDVLASG